MPRSMRAFFGAVCAALFASPTHAHLDCVFPPHPGPLERIQPDGSRVEVFQRGDAFGMWLEDSEGRPLVETQNGLVYATLAADGSLAPSDVRAGAIDARLASWPRYVVPARAAGAARPVSPGAKSGLSTQQPTQSGGAAFVTGGGTVKNLVILLRFSNHGPGGQNRTLPSAANVTTIMNAVGGDPVLAPTGSVRDHYLQTSYGQFTIDSTVVTWINAPNTETYYANGNSGLTSRTWELITAGLNSADASVDFSQYDENGDGWVDAITFLHSGYGAEWGGVDQYGTNYVDRMWSHKWSIPTWTSAEGVKVSDYNISPGLWGTSGSAPGRIGVVCHELAHFFGLPDLYDTGGVGAASQGIGNWCLMAGGSWGFDSSQQYPSHLSAWAKVKLGWVVPQLILPGAHSLARVETSPAIYKIDSGYPPGEYLLVENRQQTGFDAQLPQGGLAVWHVDEAKGSFAGNNPNNDEGYPGQTGWPGNARHYRTALLQADGGFDMERNLDRGDAGDVYHSGGTSQITNTSTPNTDAYQTGFNFDNNNRLTSIGASSATMAFTYQNTSAPTITTSSLPAGSQGVAYSTTLVSSGGTNPKTWSEFRTTPGYAMTNLGPQTFVLGGIAQNWKADDAVWALNLPFAFPYFDTQYTKVYVSSNGFLDLAPTASEFENRAEWLRFAIRIAPMWDDLRTDEAGQDIYVDTSVGGQVRIRWQAEHFDSGVAANVAVVLYSDGRIRFDYGTGNTGLSPTVGVSRGESGWLVVPASHDGEPSLTNAASLLFTLQGSQIPAGMTLSSAGVLSGTPTAAGTFTLWPRVTDAVLRYDQKALTLSIGGNDTDGDGVANGSDNCPTVPNPSQSNADGDATGDACDPCTDTDGDGFGNPGFPANTCPLDGCPSDPAKSAPGQCGCGVPDTDSDGDGTANCNDGCPNDPLKVAPGICGCGVADTDSDGDGVANCNDGCPNDPLKTAPGACGCGTPDTDSDGDGTPNCHDGCPNDPLKVAPGICGCGVADTDSDGDGVANCNDGCPSDPLKTAPGQCGCGTPDTDSDGDGTANCNDQCPNDPLKVVPGICGCGVADTDSDGDGVANCNDGCPTDPLKTAPGQCGCGTPDTDSDGDGTANCDDQCPDDPLKIVPGICGCGIADTDSDGDGVANCNDGCPSDPLKTAPGACGCGVPDTDSDGDGTPNCNDGCPNDPLKIAPGVCGCGVPDTDSDGDGTYDCDGDKCPFDPLKIAPGICGCGVADTDSDGDGTANCLDGCPNDPLKIDPGACGCGVSDADTDSDGVLDCDDNCDAIANPSQADCDTDGVGDACAIAAGAPDCNTNGVPDACDVSGGASSDLDGNGVPDECTGVVAVFCFGDGSGTACPCGNASALADQAGCLNSLGLAGRLVGSGTPRVSADTLVLSGTGMPNSAALYFQGTTKSAGGAGVAFGDGLRCAAGAVIRLGTKFNSGNASSYPQAGDLLISVKGALPPTGGTRHYQIWYRNAAAFCQPETFNLTNGVTAVWAP